MGVPSRITVAGQPFPFVDPDDLRAATNIILEQRDPGRSRPTIMICATFVRERDHGTQPPVSGARLRTDVGHYAGYNEVGRTEVSPLPI